eukprot:TRINITY_DN54471_c0_g1_i1.p1 TRINITY_DN54471_c0_g1~~TRINITY_DN54471_c0_g1_i1.p1  ORF type:complete len:519 (+),score=53.86 TRINITY_DN54471_c0_g1_i1:151-1557(+)
MGCASSAALPQEGSFHDTYQLGKKLGVGAFGQVRVGTRRDCDDEYAIKITAVGVTSKADKREVIDKEKCANCEMEAKMGYAIGCHPHCVQTIDWMREGKLHYIVMELCADSLMDTMSNNPSLIENDLPRIFGEMLKGIAHCHNLGIVHRDVKPDNFIFGGPDGAVVKLCDFGVAAALPKKGYLRGHYGTAPYMAPEMVNNEKYNTKVDVWSFGVVAYLMLFGSFPYMTSEMDSVAMKQMIGTGIPKPQFVNDARGEFARVLLNRSMLERCTATDAMKLPFLWSCQARQARQSTTSLSSEMRPALTLARKATQELGAFVDPTVQRTLDDLFERLQHRLGRSASTDAVSSFACFSETPEMQHGESGCNTAETRIVPRLRKQNTHAGILRSGSFAFGDKFKPTALEPIPSAVSTKDSLPIVAVEDCMHQSEMSTLSETSAVEYTGLKTMNDMPNFGDTADGIVWDYEESCA